MGIAIGSRAGTVIGVGLALINQENTCKKE
jgi:hypothetical protein